MHYFLKNIIKNDQLKSPTDIISSKKPLQCCVETLMFLKLQYFATRPIFTKFQINIFPQPKKQTQDKENLYIKYVNFLVKSLQNINCNNKISEQDMVFGHCHVVVNANKFTSK